MYMPSEPEYEYHVENYGDPADFGYKDFIPLFTADKWDPAEWAKRWRKAG